MIRRGDVWWADLGEPRGSEPAFRRPVLVVQDDLLTKSALSTVLIVPLTSNLRRAEAVGNVVLDPRDTGLERKSVALVCQIMTLDKDFFIDRAGHLSAKLKHAIDTGLRLALSLS